MNQGSAETANSPKKGRPSQRKEQNGPQKKKRIAKGVNVGRPSKKSKKSIIQQNAFNSQQEHLQVTNTIQDPLEKIYDVIMMLLIDFFHQTNQKKGFVYNRDARLKLKRQTQHTMLEESRWFLSQQKVKALRKIREMFNQSLGELQEKVIKVLVQTSGIFSEEFTNEYYMIVLEVFRLTLVQREKDTQDQTSYLKLANDIYTNAEGRYVFFSYEFREGLRLGVKDEFIRPADDTHYRELIKGLRDSLTCLD